MVRRASGLLAFCAAATLTATTVAAGADGAASFIFDGERIKIALDRDAAQPYAARFATLEAECDPVCIVPATVAEGVATIAEPEVLAFFEAQVGENEGLVVDARMPQGRALGHIPGSVSLPHLALDPQNEFRDDILKALGVRSFEDLYNFSDAQALVVYDNGPLSDDAGRLILHLLDAGYPPEKIRYYRGGMQVWSALGLSIQE